MNPIVRNILALLAGAAAGSVVNMGLIMMGAAVIPAPEGADVTTYEGLRNSIHLFETKHFLFPFLGHALGTFAGALAAGFIAATRKMIFALVIGVFFLAGGVTNVVNLPAPAWFGALDLVAAYIPMAWLGGRIAVRKRPEPAAV